MEEENAKCIEPKFKVQPSFNKVIVTLDLDKDQNQEDGVVLDETGLSETQTVMASGPHSLFKEGQRVILDLEKMSVSRPSKTDQYKMNTSIKIDPITVDGVTYAFIEDRCIKATDYR